MRRPSTAPKIARCRHSPRSYLDVSISGVLRAYLASRSTFEVPMHNVQGRGFPRSHRAPVLPSLPLSPTNARENKEVRPRPDQSQKKAKPANLNLASQSSINDVASPNPGATHKTPPPPSSIPVVFRQESAERLRSRNKKKLYVVAQNVGVSAHKAPLPKAGET